ncbi:uncharacterized protein LOC135682827 [Rhopilema esculentum]|uniref:uncharacterized protein LOC135682827 n=1 Tax=Rhopilema esculentum TaxID=499914 RepID=UPI0031D6C22F
MHSPCQSAKLQHHSDTEANFVQLTSGEQTVHIGGKIFEKSSDAITNLAGFGMNSIFDTEEDFDFSDDDLLDGSIFTNSNISLQLERGNKSSTNGSDSSEHFGNGPILRTFLNTEKLNNTEKIPFEGSSKDYSISTKRLKDISNGTESDLTMKGLDIFKPSWSTKPCMMDSQNRSNDQSPLIPENHNRNINPKFKFFKKTVTTNGKKDKINGNYDNKSMQAMPKKPMDIHNLQNGLRKCNRNYKNSTESNELFEKSETSIDNKFLGDESTFEDLMMDNKHKSLGSSDCSGTLPEQRLEGFSHGEEIIITSFSSEDESILTPSNKRQFPGPAGLLPKLANISDTKNFLTPTKSIKKRAKTPKIENSQVAFARKADKDFKQPFWLQLQKDAMNKYKGLVYHSIATIHKKARAKQLVKGKVPLMCALIKTFTLNSSDASIILKDPTGEIHGTIHKAVLEGCQTGLCPGAGLILRQVSIFSPTSRKHYVNITPSNIVILLSPDLPSSASLGYSPAQPIFEFASDKNRDDSDSSNVHSGRVSKDVNEDLDEILTENDDFASWFEESEEIMEELTL